MVGTIKSFHRKHGYGFLLDEKGTEYFFHILQWKDRNLPKEGEKATFKPIKTDKGMKAEDICRIRSNG